MKICYFGHGIQEIGGGNSQYYFHLSKKMAELGHEITVVSSGKRRKDLPPDIEFVGLSRGNSRLEKLFIFPIKSIYYFLFHKNYDLIHAGSSYSGFAYLCKIISIQVGIPIVYSVFSYGSLPKKLTFDKLIYTSKRLAGKINKPGTYVPPFVDVKNFIHSSKYTFDQNNRYIIGTVGTPLKRRGHMTLLEAVPSILNENRNILFIFAIAIKPQIYRRHEGMGLQRIEEFIERNNLKNNVQIIGKVDIPAFFNSIDLFIYPLETTIGALDITPTVIECLSAGCPLIVSNVGAHNEVIQDGFNGFLVDRQNPEAYASKIIEVLNNQTCNSRIKQNAKESVSQFSIEKNAYKILQLYKKTIHEFGKI